MTTQSTVDHHVDRGAGHGAAATSLLRTARWLEAELNRRLVAGAGLSCAQYHLLAAVADAPECVLRMHEVAAAVGSTPSGATRQVESLERTA